MASTKRAKKKQQKSLKPSFPLSQFLTSLLLLLLGSGIVIYTALEKAGPIYLPKTQLIGANSTDHVVHKPTKLYIPKMAKILAVSDGIYENGRWTTTPVGVSFYLDSALPGNGNTVIYGHNTKDVIGGLWRVQDGDSIYVVLQSGDFVKYQVYERKEIKPTQIEILKQTGDSRLTLYTCSGALDTARYVVVAKKV